MAISKHMLKIQNAQFVNNPRGSTEFVQYILGCTFKVCGMHGDVVLSDRNSEVHIYLE